MSWSSYHLQVCPWKYPAFKGITALTTIPPCKPLYHHVTKRGQLWGGLSPVPSPMLRRIQVPRHLVFRDNLDWHRAVQRARVERREEGPSLADPYPDPNTSESVWMNQKGQAVECRIVGSSRTLAYYAEPAWLNL